jgi:lysozyme family protein
MNFNYSRCLANTLVEEGGYVNNPKDPGGPTMRGVIQKVYDQHRDKYRLTRQPVSNITEGEVQAIYRTGYWDVIKGDQWPKGPDQIVFDIAVNSGPGNARKLMARALGQPGDAYIGLLASHATNTGDRIALCKKACATRGAFYRSLRQFGTFGRGWMRRNARIEAISVKMAAESDRLSDADTNKLIEKEKKAAAKKEAANKKAAAGTGGGGAVVGGGSASQIESLDWTSIMIMGLLAAGVVLAVGLFVYNWQNNRARVQAYAALAADALEMGWDAAYAKIIGDAK